MSDKKATRVSWRAHTGVRELTEWMRWVEDGASKFDTELLDLIARTGGKPTEHHLTQQQFEIMGRLRDCLAKIKVETGKLAKETRRFHGGIVRARKAS